MAIRILTGLPRAGKTFNAIQNYLLPALEDGRHIVTNILLRMDTIYKLYPNASIEYFDKKTPIRKDSSIEKYLNLDSHPAGSVFILDEFWRYLESGTRQDKMPEEVKSFFTEHGHCVSDKGFTTEIILISQSASHVNGFVKSLIDETIYIDKQENLGKPFYICNFYDYYYNHLDGKRESKNTARGFYDTKHKQIPIGDFYVSHTKNQQTEFNKGLEVTIDNRSNPLKKPIIKYGLPTALVLMVWGCSNVYTMFAPEEPLTQENTTAVEVTQTPIPDNQPEIVVPKPNPFPVVVPPEPKENGLSNNWELIGYLRAKSKSIAMIRHNDGSLRQIDFNKYCQLYRGTTEAHCTLDGSKITRWSGGRSSKSTFSLISTPN